MINIKTNKNCLKILKQTFLTKIEQLFNSIRQLKKTDIVGYLLFKSLLTLHVNLYVHIICKYKLKYILGLYYVLSIKSFVFMYFLLS